MIGHARLFGELAKSKAATGDVNHTPGLGAKCPRIRSEPCRGRFYQQLPGGAGISIILESTTEPHRGPRLHKHPYAETFIISLRHACGFCA